MDPFMIVMLVGMLGLMFWMQSRAKKQARERDSFRSSLQPGQRVMTQGGLVGTILSVNPETNSVILESAGSQCEYMLAGIAKTLDLPGATGVSPLATPVPAAATGGLLANTLGNLSGAANAGAQAQVDDVDLADLDTISREYYESRAANGSAVTGQTSAPVVVIEEE